MSGPARSGVRWLLAAVACTGVTLSVVGATGVLAVFTDTATTGASGDPADMDSVETAPIDAVAVGADIEIARYPLDPSCGPFDQELAGALIQAEGVAPGATGLAGLGPRGLCVRNVGDQEVSVVLSAIDVSSFEVSCEPDEALVDPQGATCGFLGESGLHIRYQATLVDTVTNPDDCPASPVATGTALELADAAPAFTLASGDIGCLAIELSYLPPTEDDAAAAQTDRTRWRFQVEATAP